MQAACGDGQGTPRGGISAGVKPCVPPAGHALHQPEPVGISGESPTPTLPRSRGSRLNGWAPFLLGMAHYVVRLEVLTPFPPNSACSRSPILIDDVSQVPTLESMHHRERNLLPLLNSGAVLDTFKDSDSLCEPAWTEKVRSGSDRRTNRCRHTSGDFGESAWSRCDRLTWTKKMTSPVSGFTWR